MLHLVDLDHQVKIDKSCCECQNKTIIFYGMINEKNHCVFSKTQANIKQQAIDFIFGTINVFVLEIVFSKPHKQNFYDVNYLLAFY